MRSLKHNIMHTNKKKSSRSKIYVYQRYAVGWGMEDWIENGVKEKNHKIRQEKRLALTDVRNKS